MRPPLPPKKEEIHPDALINVIKKEPMDIGLERKVLQRHEAHLPKGIFWGVTGLIVFFIGGLVVSFYVAKDKLTASLTTNAGTLQAGIADLQNLDPGSAALEFSSLTSSSPGNLGGILGTLGFLFEGGHNAIGAFSDLSSQLAMLSDELNTLQTNALGLLFSGQGDALVSELKNLRATMGAIDTASGKLANTASFEGDISSLGGGDIYLSLKSQLASAESFLDAITPWLANPAPHHLLVLLENSSEMRPGGGFLGSYADVTIAGGNITNISVHDVADVDLAFTKNIIPPKPLQDEITRFRPADANWFFDFPTTASETLNFFKNSSLYNGTSTVFDGAIAVSPGVVSDLLSLTGPVTVGTSNLTFTADNFLVQTQKIVQNGQATSATYPKQILRDLTSAIFTKLASSTDNEKQALVGIALNWITNRDLMIYFKNPTLESFMDSYGASGAVYEPPQNFNGDYLAVADANINSGKSNLYVSSTVAYTAEINADGTLTGHVVITRTNNGNESPYPWYDTTNMDYLQVLVPYGTTLEDSSGGVAKKITEPINYAKNGYLIDPLIFAEESSTQTIFNYPSVTTHEEFGKEVFATWSTIKPGASAQISFDYTHDMFVPPAVGVAYQFVFEKQAGTSRHYDIEIDAPLGYAFAENGLASYIYHTDDLPGRLTVPLTLEKIPE